VYASQQAANQGAAVPSRPMLSGELAAFAKAAAAKETGGR